MTGSLVQRSAPTFNSSLIFAFGFNSRSYGLLRWLRTSRLCLSSTGFSLAMSGSTMDQRYVSEDKFDETAVAAGCTGITVVDDELILEES